LVRERRTGKHGERACERQHQCENLFLMADYITKTLLLFDFPYKITKWTNFFKSLYFLSAKAAYAGCACLAQMSPPKVRKEICL
ncbi:MAG: hypothetical protein KH195_13920, partial [Clostridiaceae bacterium]|nr:hypothetical protein [Clostridiaceae bacterium]